MEPINYMDFVITPTKYGGFFYTPKWHDGSEPVMTASTVADAKVEIEAYWLDKIDAINVNHSKGQLTMIVNREGKKMNNSQLSYVDCCMRIYDENRPFEEMSNDDLDSVYYVAFGRWAYHLTREGYISLLNAERRKRNDSRVI